MNWMELQQLAEIVPLAAVLCGLLWVGGACARHAQRQPEKTESARN